MAGSLRRLGGREPRRAWRCSNGCHAVGLPEGWEAALPVFEPNAKGIATRAASGKILTAIAPILPELWGGSADLAESNNTTPEGQPSFLPEDRQSQGFSRWPYGRVLHFGIREHAMGAILNGIALHGGTRPYGGTFLTFSDYMRGAVRLAAIMKLPVTYVWTHDSIGLGEDGPTHQPIEQLAALRAIPGLDVVRPADANETAVAWRTILENIDRPAGLVLSRQNLPIVDRTVFASAEGVAKGAYILADASSGKPDAIIIAHRQRGVDRYRSTGIARSAGHADQSRVDALPGMVPGARSRLPTARPATRRQGSRVHRGCGHDGLARFRRRPRRNARPQPLRRERTGRILFEQFGITADRLVAACTQACHKVGGTKGSTTGN